MADIFDTIELSCHFSVCGICLCFSCLSHIFPPSFTVVILKSYYETTYCLIVYTKMEQFRFQLMLVYDILLHSLI